MSRNMAGALILALLAAASTWPSPPVVAKTQTWMKKGRVLEPGFAGTASQGRLSAPCVVVLKNGRLRMYFWATGKLPGATSNKSYIYAAEADPKTPFDWKLINDAPVLGPSPSGNLNDFGPSFPFVVAKTDGSWLMYFCAWGSWAPSDELSNRTGLAISQDGGNTWKIQTETLIPLGKPGEFDAGLTGSVCVLPIGRDLFHMWYSAGEHYEMIGGTKRGIVHIGHATSRDGIGWTFARKPVLSPRLGAVTPYEAVVSKPSVLRIGGTFHMWLSVFSMDEVGYRLGYARSADGVHWERSFGDDILELTPGAFDSKNQSYPNVVEVGDELWMFYAGNTFGATGVGLATMKKADLR